MWVSSNRRVLLLEKVCTTEILRKPKQRFGGKPFRDVRVG
jgi:hypothetical protein